MSKSKWTERLQKGVLLGTAGMLALSGVAFAQTQSEDEIVVTATRREQSVTDIPLSVSAFSGQQLEAANVVSLDDLTKLDSTFSVQNFGAAFNQFIIRGVQSDIGATIGMYIDEVPLTGGSGTEGGGDGKPGLRLHDIERVEILRGPQGTLFGSGSMSGTLRVITRQPEFENFSTSASVSGATVEDGNALWGGDVAVNVPIADWLAVRLVAWAEEGGGYIDQRIGAAPGTLVENVNDQQVRGTRLLAAVRPAPQMRVTAAAVHQEIDVDGSQNWLLGAGSYINLSPTLENYSDQYDLYSLTTTYDLAIGTITGAVSLTRQRNFRPQDTTPTAAGFGVPFLTSLSIYGAFDAVTAELRFASDFEGPLQIVVGGYSERSERETETNAVTAPDATGIPDCLNWAACHAAGTPLNTEFSTIDFRDVDESAIYGQADLELSERLTATAGLRYYSASITDSGITQQDVFATDPICSTFYVYRGFGPPNLCGYAFGDITVPYSRGTSTSDETELSYNFSLLWEPTDAVSFFARAGSGFRIGGVNNSTLLASSAGVTIPASYSPDSLWSYEVGAKGYFWDRRGFFDVALYRIDWQDQQLNATDSSGAFDFTINAGKTEINGAELQGSLALTDHFSVSGGIVYTDASLGEDLPPEAGAPGLSGDQIPRVAEWAGSLRAEFIAPVMGSGEFYVNGGLNYRGESFTAFNPSDPLYLRQKPYTVFDLAGGVRMNEWDVGLFVQNVGNDDAQYALDPSPDGLRVYSPRPRTIGLRLSSSFN